MIYLDYAATGLMPDGVKKALREFLELEIGNPTALHRAGNLAKLKIEETREKVAAAINADVSEIIFTSGGSESNNTVLWTFAGKMIAVSEVEHPSVLVPAKTYGEPFVPIKVNEWGEVEKLSGSDFDGAYVMSENANGSKMGREGNAQFGALVDGESDAPALVSVMMANNEVGTVNDVKNLCAAAKKRWPKVFFHTDATQAFGKIKIDVKDLGVDYVTLSGHKIGAPVGVGVLYVKKGAPFTPLILGGAQEKRRRAGTQNTMAIVGLGAALDILQEDRVLERFEKEVRPVRDELAAEILRTVPYSSLNHKLEKSLPHILNVSFQAAEGESIQLYLDLIKDIVVSTGSACATGDGKPSHVLMALSGGDAEVAHSSTRFSLGLDFRREQIPIVVETLRGVVEKLQKISTIKIKE